MSHAWPYVVHQDPFHSVVRQQMLSWLKSCDAEHSSCLPQFDRGTPLPTRVLDLDMLPSCNNINVYGDAWRELFRNRKIQLVETHAGQCGQYVALSYCWGSSLPCKTTTENLSVHTRGLDMDHLPNTLRDSIMVTRLLGVRYIWIDCLCM
jgi:hypothetical protein